MNSNNVKSKGIGSLLIVALTACTLFFLCPQNIDDVYYENYIVDSICIVVCEFLLVRLYLHNNLSIFEPITFISVIYILMYFVAPIHDIRNGYFLWYGYSLFPYGVKTSLIELAGYVCFYIIYTNKFVFGKRNRKPSKVVVIPSSEESKKDDEFIIRIILIMYFFCFIMNLLYMVQIGGNSVLYVLTLGFLGSGNEFSPTESSLGFVSMFSYSLPTATLLYWEYSSNKFMKIVLFFPMLMMQVTRGFRFFVIQIFFTFFMYYHIANKKKPRIISIVGYLIILAIPVVLMTMFRNSIRYGSGIDTTLLTSNNISSAIDETIWGNFRIYQNVYGMVNAIPSTYPYVYLRQILIGTIIMLVPRALWPGKISMYGGVGLKTLIGNNIASGQAYPNIGEYYYSLGLFGVLFFMGIYGWWMKKTKERYFECAQSGLDIIVFSTLVGSNLQILIRGYTPSNFWYVIFAVLPAFILKKVIKNTRRSNNNLEN